MSSLFPIFVKLDGRRVLVVGAGRVAEAKISQLLNTGCAICVVAPKATAQIRLWAADCMLDWEEREFRPSDLDGSFLAVACTPFREVNACIYRSAAERGVLCNVVDVPDLCDFYYPAIVKRGDLQIAISTSVKSPALAQRIRQDLEARFTPECEIVLGWLGRIRRWVLAQNFSPQMRKRLLHACASRPAEALLRLLARTPRGAKA